MSLSWFEKLMPTSIRTDSSTKRGVPEGLWTKCASCNAVLYRAELERNLDVCPKCNHHMRVFGGKRLEMFLDDVELLGMQRGWPQKGKKAGERETVLH